MTKTMLSWGEYIWEDKIKRQNEAGVIFGFGATKSQIDKQTKYGMRRLDKEVLPLIKDGGRILDVGIGPMARYSIEFAKRGFNVVGLDISKTTLRYARDYIKKTGLGNIKLVEGDMINFQDKRKYDFILCIGTFYHIPAHLAMIVLRNFNKMLSKGGYALIEFHIKWERKLFDIIHELIYEVLYKATRNILKSKVVTYAGYTDGELYDILTRTGFRSLNKINNNRFRFNDVWLVQKIKDVSSL